MVQYSLSTIVSVGEEKTYQQQVNRFLTWLTIELAPTICGSKPSTILTLTDTKQQALFTLWKQYGDEVLNETMVKYIVLRSAVNKETVLFYRSDILQTCITNIHHRNFLQSLGYKVDDGVDACLDMLKKRFASCCPHEMGILLGIPLKDVLGFMSMTKLPQTCRREWCIYGNEEVSLAVMKKFATDRSFVSCMLADGMTPYEIMCGKSEASYIAS